MIVGLILIAMIAAAAASFAMALLSAPLWIVILAYPVTGSVVLVSALALWGSGARRWSGGDKPTFLARVSARFRAGQPRR